MPAGSRSTWPDHDGEQVSLWLISKIMEALGIAGHQPRVTKQTTVPADDVDGRPDRIRRRFTPPLPTSTLVGDITYLPTGEGWLYLATVIDLSTRMIVGWRTPAEVFDEQLRLPQQPGVATTG